MVQKEQFLMHYHYDMSLWFHLINDYRTKSIERINYKKIELRAGFRYETIFASIDKQYRATQIMNQAVIVYCLKGKIFYDGNRGENGVGRSESLW